MKIEYNTGYNFRVELLDSTNLEWSKSNEIKIVVENKTKCEGNYKLGTMINYKNKKKLKSKIMVQELKKT